MFKTDRAMFGAKFTILSFETLKEDSLQINSLALQLLQLQKHLSKRRQRFVKKWLSRFGQQAKKLCSYDQR